MGTSEKLIATFHTQNGTMQNISYGSIHTTNNGVPFDLSQSNRATESQTLVHQNSRNSSFSLTISRNHREYISTQNTGWNCPYNVQEMKCILCLVLFILFMIALVKFVKMAKIYYV